MWSREPYFHSAEHWDQQFLLHLLLPLYRPLGDLCAQAMLQVTPHIMPSQYRPIDSSLHALHKHSVCPFHLSESVQRRPKVCILYISYIYLLIHSCQGFPLDPCIPTSSTRLLRLLPRQPFNRLMLNVCQMMIASAGDSRLMSHHGTFRPESLATLQAIIAAKAVEYMD